MAKHKKQSPKRPKGEFTKQGNPDAAEQQRLKKAARWVIASGNEEAQAALSAQARVTTPKSTLG